MGSRPLRFARSIPSAAACSRSIGQRSPVITMSENSQPKNSEQMALFPMSSAEGSRARTFLNERTEDRFVRRKVRSLARVPSYYSRGSSRSTLSWRTSQGCFIEGSEKFSGTWPRAGMMRSGDCIPASSVGLPQTRDRVWIVAYPGDGGRQTGDERLEARSGPVLDGLTMTDWVRLELGLQACARRAWRRDDGVPLWVDRLRGLGNAVVPQIPELIGRAILASLEHREAA
jgi:hypothetical protein